MQIERIKKTIRGNEYEFGYLPALANLSLVTKLGSITGISLKDFIGMFTQSGGDMSKFGEGIHNLFKSIYTNDPSLSIVIELLSQTSRNGVALNKQSIDTFYTGKLGELLEVLGNAIYVQFADFLELKDPFTNLIASVLTKLGLTVGSTKK